jgi:murein endopeptidase/LysM repeat protein
MRRCCLNLVAGGLRPWWICFLLSFVFISFSLSLESARALTESIGQPYHGRLVNGIPFPNEFRGYELREEDHTYTTPELIGALLDAFDAVRHKYPDTCDVYLGDFSHKGGGFFSHHRSHQNGRDVDIGLYEKGNQALHTLVPMNEENLDIPKTWCLIENILRSQRVQYIFLDRSIQKLLYDYALSQGVDQSYLDHLFGNVGGGPRGWGATIQHVPHHYDHMHVRFFTPWSTMAAHVRNMDEKKEAVIEIAQQAYLPKKVLYYAKGAERSLDSLAQSFGVNRQDLCRWNRLRGGDIPTPGSCLVFYKRGFELEPVHLAESIRPDSVPESTIQYASLNPAGTMSDVSPALHGTASRHRKADSPVIITCSVRRGDTLDRIAKRNGIPLKSLIELNGMKRHTVLKPGQKIKLTSVKSSVLLDHKHEIEVPRSSGSRSSRLGSISSHAGPSRSSHSTSKSATPSRVSKHEAPEAGSPVQTGGAKKSAQINAKHKARSMGGSSPKQVAVQSHKSASSSGADASRKSISHSTAGSPKVSASHSAGSKSREKQVESSRKVTTTGKKSPASAQAIKKKGQTG